MFFVLYFKNNLTYTLNELIYGCLWSSVLYLRKKKAEKETEMNASWFFFCVWENKKILFLQKNDTLIYSCVDQK